MGPLDAIIQLLLFVCFGVYLFMGLVLFGMGIAYAYDDGAVGSAGLYMIFLGLMMLIVGGFAIFCNLKKIWLGLFIIELINLVLFLVRLDRKSAVYWQSTAIAMQLQLHCVHMSLTFWKRLPRGIMQSSLQ